MRERIGNPHEERHGKDLRCYDFIAPAGTDPHEAALKAEAALGIKLFHRGDGEQHGYVNTSRRPDGSVYVCITLYEACANDADCQAGHYGVKHIKAATPKAGDLTKVKADVGEHAVHKLSGDEAKDVAVLRAVGFADLDSPMPEVVKTEARARIKRLQEHIAAARQFAIENPADG